MRSDVERCPVVYTLERRLCALDPQQTCIEAGKHWFAICCVFLMGQAYISTQRLALSAPCETTSTCFRLSEWSARTRARRPAQRLWQRHCFRHALENIAITDMNKTETGASECFMSSGPMCLWFQPPETWICVEHGASVATAATAALVRVSLFSDKMRTRFRPYRHSPCRRYRNPCGAPHIDCCAQPTCPPVDRSQQ
jgi:hypothetical protein